MNLTELERDIKKELRASMNGILSARMRQAGMPFKLIFGTELPRLQDIAREFPIDAELAQHLWQQPIRETKLLAIMLMPVEAFTPAVTEAWAETMVTAEEAQIMAMLLLPEVPEAEAIAKGWLESDQPLPATCGALCLRHLLTRGCIQDAAVVEAIQKSINQRPSTDNLHLKKALQALSFAIIEKKEGQNSAEIK